MRRSGRRPFLVLLVLVLVTTFALAASAQSEGEDGSAGGTATTTTVSGLTPAVDAGQDEAAAPLPDWTYRYLVPTGLLLAAVIILFTAIKYFTDVVRKRYRIVE